ncbi:hypothetical protein A7Q09_00345 [Methylacidiphilum sp. Yel]|jgi:hypothetical protein|uniref:hypothetical protein n=1 Tax=Methylacidiphilum sp. Yel TaxID=1847730 RepID=UPI00106D6DBF|nr:hypothetical protein [Methylacidiphilum sp. Yel]TFE69850.1 hypothetical protein A7Q09_00345 [Methylacidiphilum sp. Yel]
MASTLTLILTVSRQSQKYEEFLKKLFYYKDKGHQIYIFCLDEGVREITSLLAASKDFHIFACAYAIQSRNLSTIESVCYGGLGLLADLIVHSDKTESF